MSETVNAVKADKTARAASQVATFSAAAANTDFAF